MRGASNQPESNRVTSHDVAHEAGVSQATVTRVFASPEKVAAATKARVIEAADRLGYVPNAIARSLKAQRTDIIGAVLPASGEYWQGVVTAFSNRLTSNGRHLLLFSFADVEQVSEVTSVVAQYRLDGLIAASASIDMANLARIDRLAIPVVSFNQPQALGLMDSVMVDNEGGMRLLADHLIAAGVRSAVYLGGVSGTSTDRQRYRGAAARLAQSGVVCPHVEAGAFTYEAGYKAAAELIDAGLPDAVLVGADEIAFGLIDGMRERGVTAPADVLVTGFDGLPQARWAGYDLTTLEQPTELLVQHAVELLFGEAEPLPDHDDARPTGVVVPGQIRQGRTTNRA